MEQRKAAYLVEELPEFEWDAERKCFYAILPESGTVREYTPPAFHETLVRMATASRESRIGGRISAEIIPFPHHAARASGRSSK